NYNTDGLKLFNIIPSSKLEKIGAKNLKINLPSFYNSQFPYRAVRDSKGHFWTHMIYFKDQKKYLLELDGYLNFLRRKSIEGLNVPNISMADSTDNLWLITGSSITKVQQSTLEYRTYELKYEDNPLLATILLQDESGCFWLGSPD